MKGIVQSTASALLILLYIYAATSKLLSFPEFRQQLHNQTFPAWLAGPLLYGLPLLELLTAVLLCFRQTLRAGFFLSLGLLVAFTAYISLVLLHYWERVPCSCGGILNHLSWTAHLIFNWTLLILNLSALMIHPRPQYPVP